jgi:lysozyme family protein
MTIEIVINRVLKREGGFVIDHAGPTNFGITIPPYKEYTKKDITEQDIRNMTKEEAIGFYSWLFTKKRLAEINNFELMDLLFDSMINHGNEVAVSWAQKYAKVTRDGILGPISIAAINKDFKSVYYGVLSERFMLVGYIAKKNPDKYLKYLEGWINRYAKFIKEI